MVYRAVSALALDSGFQLIFQDYLEICAHEEFDYRLNPEIHPEILVRYFDYFNIEVVLPEGFKYPLIREKEKELVALVCRLLITAKNGELTVDNDVYKFILSKYPEVFGSYSTLYRWVKGKDGYGPKDLKISDFNS